MHQDVLSNHRPSRPSVATGLEVPVLASQQAEHLISPSPQRPINHSTHDKDHEPKRDSISRVPSPPNEASREDYWPFAWNPRSARISYGPPIHVSDDDELLQDHNPRFDIDQGTWDRIHAFLARSDEHETFSFTLPPLKIANAFIGLYFKFFSPQAPILHEPTLNMKLLPPPLLAIMIITGATYSHVKGTRRFAIVALDRARYNLQLAIERDQTLMREPLVIFAVALICYNSLWCGNKRAFELSEVLRGTLITYIRRLPNYEGSPPDADISSDAVTRWKSWVIAESTKRIHWFVFMIDSQFPSLLGIRSILSLAEAFRWECPCDDDFWTATTARSWKSRLGAASQPPAPSFATAMSPFLSLFAARHCGFSGTGSPEETVRRIQPLRVNTWTSFLLLCAISIYAHEWSDDWMMTTSLIQETAEEEDPLDAWSRASEQKVVARLLEARTHILDSLSQWHQAYAEPVHVLVPGNPKTYFGSVSLFLYHLMNMLLCVSLIDLQDAMGKSGPVCITTSMRRLELWCMRDYSWPIQAAEEAAKLISLADLQLTAPYGTIGIFLAHVLLWAIFKTAPPATIDRVKDCVARARIPASTAHELSSMLTSASACDPALPPEKTGPSSIFRHGAGMLVRVRPWGVSLNLALLLHRRADLPAM
ncbi:hypothetical protein GQ53DRAFT_726795 [Thozetella sp. PMI_491]|nr:hypothetical protein GQ53DRAFT_726795 [Thozetella sp. PMI_491]